MTGQGAAYLRGEAAAVKKHFTQAKNGEKVLDGHGVVWTFQRGWWIGYKGRRRIQASPMALAKALNPDVADLLDEVG